MTDIINGEKVLFFIAMKKTELQNSKNPYTLIFLHIPKNAGRTFESILERQYLEDCRYDVYGYGNSITDAVEQLKKMPEEDKRKIKLIKGHYQFGLHEFLPQKSSYLTFLRDPVDRAVSHYHYVLRDHMHPLNKVVKAKNMSLSEYVASGWSREIDNGQTRILSGKEHEYAFGQCPGELLKLAKANLCNHFVAAGLVERFDESLALMGLKFGWKKLYYQKKNINVQRPIKSEYDRNTLRIIEKYNELDMELYEHASRELDRMIAECEPEHGLRLIKLRRENSLYAPFTLLAKIKLYAKKIRL